MTATPSLGHARGDFSNPPQAGIINETKGSGKSKHFNRRRLPKLLDRLELAQRFPCKRYLRLLILVRSSGIATMKIVATDAPVILYPIVI